MPQKQNYGDMFKEAEITLGSDIEYNASDEYKGAVTEGLKHLQNTLNPFAVSDLTNRQIMLFHKLKVLSDRYHFANLEKLTNDFALLLWSKDRNSRKEIGNILGNYLKASKSKIFGKGVVNNDRTE
jgi:hypothetical protein